MKDTRERKESVHRHRERIEKNVPDDAAYGLN